MQFFGVLQLRHKRFDQRFGEYCYSVLVAFARANNYLVIMKIDIFHAQPQTLHLAHAGTVEKTCNEAVYSMNPVYHLPGFQPAHDNRQMPWA